MGAIRYLFVVCVLLSVINAMTCQQLRYSSPTPFWTSKGLRVAPVKVSSAEGEPLLAFYMVGSSLKPKIQVHMDTDFTASFQYSYVCKTLNVSFILEVSADHENNNVMVRGQKRFPLNCTKAVERFVAIPSDSKNSAGSTTSTTMKVYVTEGEINIKLRSDVIGYGTVTMKLIEAIDKAKGKRSDDNAAAVNDITLDATTTAYDNVTENNATDTDQPHITYTITVIRKIRPVDVIFRLVVYCVQIFVATGFGAKLDLMVVKECLFKPIAPAIGLSAQFILMPLIAYAVARAIPMDIPMVPLGIFVAGCCPGGGASNMYSYLLQGDLSLSITMTAMSTVLALGMLPLWLYTLGSTLIQSDQELSIPFETVASSLSILVVPLLFGLFLRQKFTQAADKVEKLLKPVILVTSLILLVVGIYSNMYIFRLFKPRIILAGCLLPYVGYVAGGALAAVFRLPWPRIKTLSIETGMQNTSIAYLLLTNSFPAPIGDVAAVAPVASAVMTPLPLFLITIIYLIHNRIKNRRVLRKGETENDGTEEDGADEKLNQKMTTDVVTNSNHDDKDKLTNV